MSKKNKKRVGNKIVLLGEICSAIGLALIILSCIIFVASLLILLIFYLIDESSGLDIRVIIISTIICTTSGLSMYISSLFVRGYGQMVINSDCLVHIAEKLSEKQDDKNIVNPPEQKKVCPVCSKEQPLENLFCANCGQSLQ